MSDIEEIEIETAADAFKASKDVEEGRVAIAKKIAAAEAAGKYYTIGFPASAVIDELRAKGYDVDDMMNFGKIQGYKISWKNGLVENIGTFEEGENNFVDEEKQLVLTGTVPAGAKVNAQGKGVKVNNLKAEASVVTAKAAENVEISGSEISGTYDKGTQGNSMMNIKADGEVVIKNTKFDATGYNGIEIGLSTGVAKKVTISNCDFAGKFSNNAISIFAFADGAVINIENCHFEEVSNILRLSNRTNSNCTINFKNCTCDKWETGGYAGAVICQEYPSGVSDNMFGDGKIKINFFNLIGPDGKKFTGKMPEEVCATADENQLVYVYTNKVEEYDASKYPVVKIA